MPVGGRADGDQTHLWRGKGAAETIKKDHHLENTELPLIHYLISEDRMAMFNSACASSCNFNSREKQPAGSTPMRVR